VKRPLFIALLFAACALGLSPSALAQVAPTPTLSTRGTVTNTNDAVGLYCPQGQTTAEVAVNAGVTGTITVFTATNIGTASSPSPGPTGSPLWSRTAGGTTYVTTLTSFPSRLFVSLGSSPYIYAVLTTAGGGSSTIYITCSASVSTISGATPVPTPTGVASVTYVTPNPLESFLLSEPSTTHLWGMHDKPTGCVTTYCTPGPCPATVADLIASGATANPSPAPLTTVTAAPNPAPFCGYSGVYPGAGSSVLFCQNGITGGTYGNCSGNSTGPVISFLQLLLAAEPATPPWTWFCTFYAHANSTAAGSIMFDQDSGATNTAFYVGINATNNLTMITNGGAHPDSASIAFASRGMWVVTNDGTNTTLWINGVTHNVVAVQPSPPANAGGFGKEFNAAADGYTGMLEDCGNANTAWTQAKVQYAYTLMGI